MSLPTGRAVAGGFLVAASAVGIFGAYARATAGPSDRYVVARHDLAVGHRVTDDDLTTLPMDLPRVVAESAAFRTERPLIDATVVGPIRRGELVQAGSVVKKRSAATQFEVSFAVAASRAVAGTLEPGDRVDVLATFGSGGDTYSVAVVRQAQVLDTGRRGSSVASGDTETVTLAVPTSDDALAVTHAVNAGEITLVRSTGAEAPGPVGQTYRAPAAPADAKAKSGGG